jgi:glycosyltransferase involved in cell wall biosynthesis
MVGIATGFDLAVYHIFDEYSFSPADPPTPPDELEVLRSVDQVVIHSLTMMEKKGRENPHTLFLPNGVDFPLHDRDWPEPRELAGVPHPRVGYTGYLKNQLDWDLISEMVSRHPKLSFIFVGPTQDDPGVREEIERLDKEPNTLFPGMRPVEELPAWVCHFDVCIMPYQNDGYTRYISPLKLHEYLAAGHPVVGTTLPNLTPFEGTITLADSVEEWSQALTKALDPAEHAQDRIDARKEVARAHDWDHLAARLGATLLARLQEKGEG